MHLSCGVKWNGSGQDPVDHISYVAYIYTFGFIVPVTIIFTSYYKIIKTVKYKVGIKLSKNTQYKVTSQ